MKFWLITDTHFGHSMLSKNKLREDNFEEKIFKSLYRLVNNEDVLIHLGDVSFSGEYEWSMKLNQLGCKKWLVKGNHDNGSYTHYLSRGWDMVCETFSMNYFGLNILFSHIPQKDNGFDINIHGHFHNTDFRLHEPEIAEILTPKHYLLALEYNNYQVFSLERVLKDFKMKKYIRRTFDE